MARVVIIGAGFAGHTAALFLGKSLGREHDIVMINKGSHFVYLPSLIWVGVGHMRPEKTTMALAPVYEKMNVRFLQGTVTEIHPDDDHVVVEKTDGSGTEQIDYDYLIVATGPYLNFEGTPGLGPKNGHTSSVCWVNHAIECRDKYLEHVERMRRGENVKIVIGTGHGKATCQGAAFEYIANIHYDLERKGLRDKAELVWLSNEPALGDFGVGGVHARRGGKFYDSDEFMQAMFRQYGITWELCRAVEGVDETHIQWEDRDGRHGDTSYDFAMLIPQFTGPKIKWVLSDGDDPVGKIVNDVGFVLADGYYGLPYDQLRITPEAWPATYQNQSYRNIFAPGIAFAPPGTISAPVRTPNGTVIVACPPRTGMVSATTGRLVAKNIESLVNDGEMTLQGRMSEMFATCVASTGDSLWSGSAITVLVFPVVPDYVRFADTYGRDLSVTHMEAGLSGAWIKRSIHTAMLYKMRAWLGWRLIPE